MKLKKILIGLICTLALGDFALMAEVASSASWVRPLKVGAKTPEVQVQNEEGKWVSLSHYLKKPTVVVFYRGNWCMYCMKHLSEMNAIQQELKGLNYQLLAISPDKSDKLTLTRRKHKLNFTLLSDSWLEAAEAFGVAFTLDKKTLEIYKKYKINLQEHSGKPHHNLPVPTVFIVGYDQKIVYRFSEADYRVRLSAKDLLSVVKGISQY